MQDFTLNHLKKDLGFMENAIQMSNVAKKGSLEV